LPAPSSRLEGALRDAGRDSSRLEGFTWYGLRHTFASRLVMVGVDLRTVQELGGWRTLAMVKRYGHLSAAHLQAAVERLVICPDPGLVDRAQAGVEVGLELDRMEEAGSVPSRRGTLTSRQI
jgi:hypothetical protein